MKSSNSESEHWHSWGLTTMPIIGIGDHAAFTILDISSQDVILLSNRGHVRCFRPGREPIYDGEDLLRILPTFQNELRQQLIAARIDTATYASASKVIVGSCRDRAAVSAGTALLADIRPWLVACVSLARSHPYMVIGTRPITEEERTVIATKKLRAAHIELWDYRQTYWRQG